MHTARVVDMEETRGRWWNGTQGDDDCSQLFVSLDEEELVPNTRDGLFQFWAVLRFKTKRDSSQQGLYAATSNTIINNARCSKDCWGMKSGVEAKSLATS